MSKLSISYRNGLLKDLKDTREAAAYLNAALADGYQEVFMLALRDVADAKEILDLAIKSWLNRENMYRICSSKFIGACFRQCPAIDRDKLLLGPLAFLVKGKGHQFFAGTALTLNQNRGITLGNLPDRLEQLSQRGTVADNPPVPFFRHCRWGSVDAF